MAQETGISNLSIMCFELSEEQRELLVIVDRACKKVRPYEEACYLEGRYNDRLVGVFREANLLGLPISTQYGAGQGADLLTFVLAMERIGQEGCSMATFFSVQLSIGQLVLQEWGTEEQKARYLPDTTTGDRIMAFALTEPNAGSDPAGMQSTFEKKGDFYVLNGSKSWISNATKADLITTYARNREDGRISAFIVDKRESPFATQEQKHKMGLLTSDTGMIFFENTRVPHENLLGPEGKGLAVAFSALMNGRLSVAARCVGVMEDCLAEAITYARQRTTFGKPIASHQLIQRHISIIRTHLSAARLLTYQATIEKMKADEHRGNVTLRTSADALIAQAKYFATNAAFDAADRAVQVFGANGYSFENRVARHLCDTRVTRIYEGANEILEQKIALHLLGPEYSAFR